MFNVQGFYRSKGTLSNLTSRTDWNLPGSSGTLRVNTSEPSRAPRSPEPSKLSEILLRKLEENPAYLFPAKYRNTRSPTSSFSNSPYLWNLQTVPRNPQKLLQHCTAITQNKDLFFFAILKKTANLAAVAWSMTSMSTLNPFPMAGTDENQSPRNQKGGVPEHCQLMGGTTECCPLR